MHLCCSNAFPHKNPSTISRWITINLGSITINLPASTNGCAAPTLNNDSSTSITLVPTLCTCIRLMLPAAGSQSPKASQLLFAPPDPLEPTFLPATCRKCRHAPYFHPTSLLQGSVSPAHAKNCRVRLCPSTPRSQPRCCFLHVSHLDRTSEPLYAYQQQSISGFHMSVTSKWSISTRRPRTRLYSMSKASESCMLKV
ncbi:hypothetical protein BDZ85DRAFT_256973 [Elsinoe ampelina]|uniref:Uncharacterized protein n=1 Tax=Elsinoe ampelina TaxID=302913 RepID=A0A6A6GNJ4_9PEZI|nr:hypothetical protein BDZ85DRAFT_256973 [Elsinoe ampelina]